MNREIIDEIESSIRVKSDLLASSDTIQQIQELADHCISALKNGSKIIFAGNGGSFADSQHLAAEFVSRFGYDRRPLAAMALATNASVMSAIGNDFGFEYSFARELQALGNQGDVFIPITTSGNSRNILNAVNVAKTNDITTVALTGGTGGALVGQCPLIVVPSPVTARIQECHILLGHIICKIVEQTVCPIGN